MTSPRTLLTLLVAFAAAFAVTSPAAAQSGISKTGLGYETGPDNRLLLGGEWLFRLDKTGLGDVSGFQKQTTREGWAPTTVPNAWNATDTSVESMTGTIGWYRKDFKLPSASKRFSYVIRFESVNYRAKVWLNGKPVGGHTGAYLPWEVRLPAGYLKRDGTNRLVIRVDNRRYPTDFPPSGLTAAGTPTGGWWNYGGILREVYLRQIDRVDINSVIVRPELDCAACDAKVLVRATLRNYSDSPERVRATVNFGGKPMMLGSAIVGAKKFATFSRRITVRNPKLWEPGSPNLYTTRISVRGRGENALRVGWLVKTGIRSIKLQPDGTMLLNGKKLNYRGMGIHEDDPNLGFAIGSAQRRAIIAETKEIGATLLRSHYPLHPQLHELADEAGIMIWSEIPVYAVKTQYLKQAAVRQLAAKELEDNIVANQNHPSVIVWSIGNELSSRPGPVQGYYIARAVRQAKALDPTRPVGIAVAGYPSAGCQSEYGPVDVIGINEYFGWYPGPNGVIADRDSLSEYLDSVRACYPTKSVVVSEFGAEANRSGPVEEKGTFEFQQDFVRFHMGVYASKPWLGGAVYWALREFRVRPGWEGGNPRPNSPVHEKGLLRFGDSSKKPAWLDMQQAILQTQQLGPPVT
ncbi:beta galactosidase jelly roll domain-containing protein [Svornostia abyssi]|uniref:Beta galactosidase jelly roll domain-containing protein n=1 Tax=Svornostia abyssi TaxID=2898438 RepID=A0ABY5PMJ1_9ACTN|nr:beta galactosidase jelly roll domain-containing protein [Parviterribacteraceae bacterium J379]